MELEHSFIVPSGIERAWATLLDVEKIAPCMPGATLTETSGDEIFGTVRVKVGPIVINYDGRAVFQQRDAETHSIVLEASGKESRAAGTASAVVRASLHAEGATATNVVVHTDLTITGRPAKFGRGVINDVAAKLIGQFADALAAQMVDTDGEEVSAASVVADRLDHVTSVATSPTEEVREASPTTTLILAKPLSPTPSPEAINLLQVVAMPLLKRAGSRVFALLARLFSWADTRRH